MCTTFETFGTGTRLRDRGSSRWARQRANGLKVTAYDVAKSATVVYVEVRCRARTRKFVSLVLTDASAPSTAGRRSG
ncbi:hypothetical protein GCM10010361_14720 [Streptomyces olivaceiscleroticus]|uniref:Transposase n=1 Tax=Streptomyces olivaceiscleroticus TaxID=68245 RepID=A0ABN0ZLA4_9ACTN